MTANGTGGHWPRVEELFFVCLELPAERRAELLAPHEASAPEVVAEVRSLLETSERDDALLDEPFSGLALALPAEDPSAQRGRRIGGWRIERCIGEGSTGVVYECTRNGSRSAALKVLRGGVLADARSRRLFGREAEVLSRLSHPGIARVLEAGCTDEGLPWIAMELVEGEPLDAWVRRRQPPRELRLRLWLGICEAVEHAHRAGLVHRDLKPGNVLVIEAGGAPRPVVLDFGLACVAAAGSSSWSTAAGSVVGSPAYMSPEQARGETSGPWSDVWSLGMLGFELLTGRLPLPLAGVPAHEAVRVLVQRRPPRPRRLDRSLPRPLEAVLGTALGPDPGRRYPDAGAMAADLRRLLAGEPVRARRPSAVQELTRAACEHRGPFAAVVVVLVLLAAASAAMAVLLARARRAEAGARLEAAVAREASRFVVDMFGTLEPSVSLGRDVTVREMLDAAAERAAEPFSEPAVEAGIGSVLGTAYGSVGDYERARHFLGRALRAAGEAGAGSHAPRAAVLRAGLGQVLALDGDYDAAERMLRDALADDRLEPEDRVTATVSLTAVLRATGRLAEARRVHDRVGGMPAVARLAPSLRAELLDSRAGLMAQAGDPEAAKELYARALALRRAHLGELHPRTAETSNNLGVLHLRAGELDEAECCMRVSLAGFRELFGARHPHVATLLNNLGDLQRRRGRLDDAEELLREALGIRLDRLGDDHPHAASTRNNLGLVLRLQGRHAGAEEQLRMAVAAAEESLGAEHSKFGVYSANLAGALAAAGARDEALPIYERAIEVLARSLGAEHARTLATRLARARVLADAGRGEEAAAELEALAAVEQCHGRGNGETMRRIAELLARTEGG